MVAIVLLIILMNVIRETCSQLNSFDNILECGWLLTLGQWRFDRNCFVALIFRTLFTIIIHFESNHFDSSTLRLINS